jgi:hypothetical protein
MMDHDGYQHSPEVVSAANANAKPAAVHLRRLRVYETYTSILGLYPAGQMDCSETKAAIGKKSWIFATNLYVMDLNEANCFAIPAATKWITDLTNRR